MRLDPGLAEAAVRDNVAVPLGLDLHTAARGILAIADSNMVGAIRVVSVERGHDPRAFALVPFGGAGPLHGCALADLLGITTILVPPAPGVLCAEGLLAADLRTEFHRTLASAGLPGDGEARAVLAELHAAADAWFEAEQVAVGDRVTDEVALMRYQGQGGELAVGFGGSVAAALAGFRAAHQALYGFVLEAPVELVTLRVEAVGKLPAPVLPRLTAGPMPAALAMRAVHFAGGTRETPVLAREALGAGTVFEGPAILTQLDATTLVPPDWTVTVDASGALLLHKVSISK